jgi:steroid delta-isomerase-like uncharacterized protein
MDSSPSGNVRRAREQLEIAYNQRNMEGILGYYADEFVFVDHALGQELSGTDALREYVTEQWAPSTSDEVEITELLAAGDWTVASFVNTGLNDRPYGHLAASDRPFRVELCTMTKWRDGKIVEDHVYYDLYGVLAQLGHVEPLAATSQAG